MLYVSDYNVIIEPLRSIIIILQLMVSIGAIFISFTSKYYIKKMNPDIKRSYLFGIPLFFLMYGMIKSMFPIPTVGARPILARLALVASGYELLIT